LRTDSTAAANASVSRGAGWALAPLWQVRDLDRSGRGSTIVLEDFELAPVPIHAIWPPTPTPARQGAAFRRSPGRPAQARAAVDRIATTGGPRAFVQRGARLDRRPRQAAHIGSG